MFPGMVSVGHSTARDVDCHFAAGTVDTANSGCTKGTNHDSTDWMVPGTSTSVDTEFHPVPRTHAASRKGPLDGADPPSFSARVVDPA